MRKNQRKYSKYFKRYNIIPILLLIMLMTGAFLNLGYIQNTDNRILFLVAFIALIYSLISNIEKEGIKRSNKKVEHISVKSTHGLKIELNKSLEECKKQKYANVEVHIIDSKNAFLIITE